MRFFIEQASNHGKILSLFGRFGHRSKGLTKFGSGKY
jgi:uncharacterized protein (DUF924 family)